MSILKLLGNSEDLQYIFRFLLNILDMSPVKQSSLPIGSFIIRCLIVSILSPLIKLA